MKLASVRIGDRDVVAVAVTDESVIEIGNLLDLAGNESPRVPHSMREMIAGGDELRAAIEAAGGASTEDTLNLRAMTPDAWYPPVRHPGKILAVAMNNSASNARKISAPEHPAFFLKPPSCLIGHRDAIRIRPYYGSVHPEPELAVVIGKKTRDVAPEDALDAVYGFTIFNDITSNGMRAEDRFHYWAIYADPDNPEETKKVEQHLSYAARYKGTDTFGVLGPWLVTRDEIDNPDELHVECHIGGEQIADDNTRYYNYKIAEVISFISQFQTLDPGDVISLGTAFKPGAGRKSIHQANFQTVEGPVSVSIEGLGRQENPVIVEDKALSRWRLD
jgi:2-keto-4-pentenoate hydratase/2-oxohepta-3-ene-1,7-dioic acid hydratase in catechol pathway